MKHKLSIILNILWNASGFSFCYFGYLFIFDFIYIIFTRGALARYRISAYFIPFDSDCHWKKRFLCSNDYYYTYTVNDDDVSDDDALSYEEIDNYHLFDGE